MAFIDSYKGGWFPTNTLTTNATRMDWFVSMMNAAGNTLVKRISDTDAVFSFSAGDDYPTFYFRFTVDSGKVTITYIYQQYDAATSTGYRYVTGFDGTGCSPFGSNGGVMYFGKGFFHAEDTYTGGLINMNYKTVVAFLKNVFNPWAALTTSAITAGSNVTVSLNKSSVGVSIGSTVYIVGAGYGEGISKCTVTAVGSNSITLSTVALSFATGASICVYGACTFTDRNGDCYDLMGDAMVNATASISKYSVTPASNFPLLNMSILSSEAYTGKPVLSSVLVYSPGQGKFDSTCFKGKPSSSGNMNDLLLLNDDGSAAISGTATSASTTMVFNTNASYVNDSLVGKYLAIVNGTGAGQVRKITANTDTSITFSPSALVSPVAGSMYSVCDKPYRLVRFAGSNNSSYVFVLEVN